MNGHAHLDLFSGIGGFAIAAQAAGYSTLGFSEIEPYACRVLKRHWRDVPNYGDIRNIKGVRADLVTGGFPCQPYSVAGKRGGAGDDRALWPEMCRVIAESGAAWAVAENVSGIISMELDRVLSDLEGLGYTAWPLVIPACAVDARHRRDRVWIVAHRDNGQRDGQGGKIRAGRDSLGLGGETLADSNSERESQPKRIVGQERGWACNGSEDVSDALGVGCEGQRPCGQQIPSPHERAALSLCDGGNPAVWLPEPSVGRVVARLPNRSHRLRGLGNAIVPQLAFQIIKEIAKIEGVTKKGPA